jgi:hypothetical protein
MVGVGARTGANRTRFSNGEELMTMKETLISRALGVGLGLALFGALGVQAAHAEPDRDARRARGGFNLFASSTVVLIGNRVQCGLDNQGNTYGRVRLPHRWWWFLAEEHSEPVHL